MRQIIRAASDASDAASQIIGLGGQACKKDSPPGHAIADPVGASPARPSGRLQPSHDDRHQRGPPRRPRDGRRAAAPRLADAAACFLDVARAFDALKEVV